MLTVALANSSIKTVSSVRLANCGKWVKDAKTVIKMEIATNVPKVCILKQTRQKDVDHALSDSPIVSNVHKRNVSNAISVTLS